MKNLLLYTNEDQGFESRLQAALDVARLFEGHLGCLQVTPFDAFILDDPFGGVYALPTLIEAVREAEEAHRGRIETRLAGEGVSWDWQRLDGMPAAHVADRSGLADLVVLSLPGEGAAGALAMIGDVALHVRAPVLAVPAESQGLDCLGPAMVAWNGSPEAAHALRLTLPMLARAAQVHVVSINEGEAGFPATDASEYLSRHGVRSELHEWPRADRSVAEVLLDAARVLKAGYVAMGAYGHSRLRETVLGGTTRDMLRSGEVPLLLAH